MDPIERSAFGRADDMREFGLLLLQMMLLPSSMAGGGSAPYEGQLSDLRLRSYCDGAFRLRDADGDPTDGVDIEGLRAYLDADDSLRIGGVGGVDILDAADGSGWDLLQRMMAGPA